MREVSFQTIERDDYDIAYSEGVLKMVSLLDKPIHHDPHKAIEAVARKGLSDFPLKFIASDNPFENAIRDNNIFKVTIGNANLVFTAAHYNGKDTLFTFLWEELDSQANDGQTRNKPNKWWNLPK